MENSSRLTSKGQIVIPAWLRKKLGLKPGTRVTFSQSGSDIVIHPQTPEYFDAMAGILGKDSHALEILMRERKRDREKEDAKLKKYIRS